ncbi:MAG: hypothetical protein QG630_416 [Patescibacteria group bacterium]|nr:hypothetical protein [Patescibacteria group bacterium]
MFKKMFFVVFVVIALLFLVIIGFSQNVQKLIADNSFTKKVFVVDSAALFDFIEDKENELKIEAYFKKKNMPLFEKAAKFVEVSKKYNLDPFLLPAMSIKESTGGKSLFKPFNPFGYGKKRFLSFDEAIEYVADKLANGEYYKDKTLEKKLSTYNCVEDKYVSETLKFMRYIKKQNIEKIDTANYVDSFKVEIIQKIEIL